MLTYVVVIGVELGGLSAGKLSGRLSDIVCFSPLLRMQGLFVSAEIHCLWGLLQVLSGTYITEHDPCQEGKLNSLIKPKRKQRQPPS